MPGSTFSGLWWRHAWALGEDYSAIAIAIRSELRTLLRDLPHLLDATLWTTRPRPMPKRRRGCKELWRARRRRAGSDGGPGDWNRQAPGWQKKFVDAHALALEAMRAGQPQKAVDILQKEVERQLSGRGRFQRKLQLAQICIAAGKDTIAQPLLDDISGGIETHKLDEWEDREMVAGALVFLVQPARRSRATRKLKQAMFERICRLDPVQALSMI